MLAQTLSRRPGKMPLDKPRTLVNPRHYGYKVTYKEGEINHCPGCGRTHWHIGRISAECAFCSTAMPLEVSRHAERVTDIVFINRGPKQ